MWVMFMRTPRPDAREWTGRRWFAAMDALAWPALGCWMLAHVPGGRGIFIPFLTSILIVVAAKRLTMALFENRRYHFTTLRWIRPLACVYAVGIVMKVLLSS